MKKSNNRDLRKAAKNKKDEFYTMLEDIEKEMIHYTDYFSGKIIYCNCDNPLNSNFFKYFVKNFNFLSLEQLVCTSYKNSEEFNYESFYLDKELPAFVLEINEVNDKVLKLESNYLIINELLKNEKNKVRPLKGNGDFRSEECIEILKQSDVVVTNPPFSLFREFISQLIEYDKKFIILGNQNALTYKTIFPLIKEDKLWLGASIHSGDREFRVPDSYPLEALGFRMDEQGRKYIRVKGVRWFTNIEYSKRHQNLILSKCYSPQNYPNYDNYNAINVDKTSEIPKDFSGFMGVPITFLDKYNPDQFELFGIMNTGEANPGIRYPDTPHGRPLINGKEKYLRIIIKEREKHS